MDRDTYAKNFAKRRESALDEQFRWVTRMYRAAASRLEKLERQAERQFPGVFDRLDQARDVVGDTVPTWCWLPVARVQQVLADHYPLRATRAPGATEPGLAALAAAAAARVQAIAAWRAAGRHMVNLHDDTVLELRKGGDRMPADLPQRWPLHGLYVVSEAPNGALGVFLHLEWDEREQRAELRIAPDVTPTAALDRIPVQPLHLEGGTVTEAARRTVLPLQAGVDSVLGTETIPDISPGSAVDKAARMVAQKTAIWVAAADWLASDRVAPFDAAALVGAEPAADWPPTAAPSSGRSPMLWLAGPAG
ncbi:hypothetical protein [Streptomyces sp. NRRL S-1868]|uniref:hypothetical protein n=1 Tax=Streptomyces sp. NRRL S-1868 TaxID=1463892 RepID=UPI000B0FC706|nr:hypothetical protein [Streptomyces sp. NRRL S-1868]